jgi:thiamine transport system permease protein
MMQKTYEQKTQVKRGKLRLRKPNAGGKRILLKSRITGTLDKLSSKTAIKSTMYLVSIIVFFALILLPPILGIIIKWDTIGQIFTDPNRTQVRYMHSTFWNINDLNASRFDDDPPSLSNVNSTLIANTSNVTCSYGIRVWKRTEKGAEKEISSGSCVALVDKTNLTRTVEIGRWDCPTVLMNSTDSLVIRIYYRIDNNEKWSSIRTFTTKRLGATQLSRNTWAVYYCLAMAFEEGRYNHTFYIGDTLAEGFMNYSRIENFAWKSGATLGKATSAISFSFVVAISVAIVDILIGLPTAWLITRGQSRWLHVLDTLSDIPFIVPTATLGYSLLLFWSEPGGLSSLFGYSLVSPGWLLIALLHFAFSFPVVVRVMVGALLDYKLEYEQASRTLGAAPLTAARTVTFPILKYSLIASFTLAFARSLSETGATMMVAGAFVNGPIFINNYIGSGEEGPLVFVSFVLIALSSIVFVAIRLLGPKLKIPIKEVWPKTERKLSSRVVASSRNVATLLVFFVIVLVPSLFVAIPAFEAVFSGVLPKALGGVGVWQDYWQSISLSYFVGTVVTLLNVIIGLPMAILIARRKVGHGLTGVLDVLVNIPIIVPSVALGASLFIFWKQNFAFIPEIWLLIFAHLSITYPYFVRSTSAAVERISVELEEAGRTLGAKPLCIFRTIIFPLTKYSMLSGAIMMFTRSVSETGATLVVSNLVTAPVLLVNWVKNEVPTATLGLGCGFLILLSFIILLALKLIASGRRTY